MTIGREGRRTGTRLTQGEAKTMLESYAADRAARDPHGMVTIGKIFDHQLRRLQRGNVLAEEVLRQFDSAKSDLVERVCGLAAEGDLDEAKLIMERSGLRTEVFEPEIAGRMLLLAEGKLAGYASRICAELGVTKEGLAKAIEERARLEKAERVA